MLSTIAETFKRARLETGLSISALSRESDVARWKISEFELGGRVLTDDERARVRAALQRNIGRLKNLPGIAEFDHVVSTANEGLTAAKEGVAA
jgi:predicted transcriptional regulator